MRMMLCLRQTTLPVLMCTRASLGGGTAGLIMVTGTSNHASTYVKRRRRKAQNTTSSEYKDVCYQLVHEGSGLLSSKGIMNGYTSKTRTLIILWLAG